jgi:CrcB protein
MGLAETAAPADGSYLPPEPKAGVRVMRETERTTRRRARTGSRRRLDPRVVASVAVGGALGALARYELGEQFVAATGTFPWSTFVVNVSGSFLLGLLLTFVLERWPPTRYVRPFFAVGVLGAYTTFSTYSVEADLLLKEGHVGIGLAYVVGSVAGTAAAVYLGIVTGRSWPRLRRSMR